MPMKLEAHLIHWNEDAIVQFVLNYWQRAGVDRLVIHDNGSTDLSVDFMKCFPFVEIEPFDTGGQFDDYMHQSIKNECWKSSDADWVYVGDFDEVPFHPVNLKKALSDHMDCPIIQGCGYQMVSWQKPARFPDRLIHEDERVRLMYLGPNKVHFLQPSKVTDMGWGLGSHKCLPTASVTYVPDIAWFHMKDLGVEYLLKRNRQLYERLPEKVREEKKIAVHYLPGMDVKNVAAGLASEWEQAVPYNEIKMLER